MNSLKVQNFFTILCFFFFFQAQLGLGMKIEQVEMLPIILTKSGTPAEGRNLDGLPACTDQSCQGSGSLTSENDAYDYTFSMGANSKITFTFAVSQSETEFGMYFVSDPAVSMTSHILLNPSDSYPDDYVGPISGPYWNIDLVIKSSSASNRVLIVEIESGAISTTNIEFYIQVEAIQDNSTLPLGLIIAMAVVGILIFGIICICFRIKDKRRRGRISRAQAAYEAAIANAHAHHQYRHGMSIVPIHNHHHHIENKPRDPRTIPLNKENFNQRFPESAFSKFKSSFPQKTCSICLEDIGKNEKCRQLYCEHIFHSECVKLWLLNQMNKQHHGFCPNCNKNMTFPIGDEPEKRNQIEIPVE